MASNLENVRLSVLAKLQEALDEEDILADQILTMMHRYADRFTNRRVEINNLMVLQDHPLMDYGKYALGCMTGADMKRVQRLKLLYSQTRQSDLKIYVDDRGFLIDETGAVIGILEFRFLYCTFPIERIRSIISIVSISLEGFMPSILLLVVIIVAVVFVTVILVVVVIDAIVGVVIVVAIIGVVVVVMIIGIVIVDGGVSHVIKLLFVIIGFLYRFVLQYLVH
nr:hypothetical protein [Tanacetum cinerariifolium]